MEDPQPVVCAYLQLPPEQQLFFRIREIPVIFLEKLDRLSLALAASHESHPCPVTLQVMRDLREATAEQCMNLAGVMYYGHRFANRYLELLSALLRASVGEETLINVLRVNNNAGLAAEEMEGAQNAMVQFRQDITDAVRRITAVLHDNQKSSGDTIFTSENWQVVTELLHAVDECSTLLQQNGKYYRAIERQTEDEESIKSSQPSDEEIVMMQERWTIFYTSVAGLKDGFGELRIRLIRGANIQRVDGPYAYPRPSGDAMAPTGSSNPMNVPNGRKAILDSSKPGSPPSIEPTSLRSSLLQCLFSRLALKNFSKR